jgi:hypothetical protein
MRKFLCIMLLRNNEREIWSPIKEGDIVTWADERIEENGKLYLRFIETGDGAQFDSIGFVELSDYTEDELIEELEKQKPQIYETETIDLVHFNCRCFAHIPMRILRSQQVNKLRTIKRR